MEVVWCGAPACDWAERLGREPMRVEGTACCQLCLHESLSALGRGRLLSLPYPRLSFPPFSLWRSTPGEPTKPELTPEPGKLASLPPFPLAVVIWTREEFVLENCSLPMFLAFTHAEFWELNLKCPECRSSHCCHRHCCLSE